MPKKLKILKPIEKKIKLKILTPIKKDGSSNYPIDIITYKKNGELPEYLKKSLPRTKKKGFTILKLTPDSYLVPTEIKAFHAGFKHMKEITMPKIMKLKKENPNLKGFFIAEGDIWIDENYDFKQFLEEDSSQPIWLGYKKKLSNYIVGNFLLYFPTKDIDKLNEYFIEQKRLVFSDRFFSKLYFNGFIKLKEKSVADEIEHYSEVHKAIRKSKVGVK